MKALPIGIHTFARLIEGNLLYVDKTEELFQGLWITETPGGGV